MDVKKWPLWLKGYNFWRAPAKAIDYWFDQLKAFIHRGRYGWSGIDVWDMDSYITFVIPAMLRHLAKNHNGVPMRLSEKYNGDVDKASKEWEKELIDIAEKIEFYHSENDEHNPYAEDYWAIALSKNVNDPMPIEKESLKNNFYQEDAAISMRKRKAIKEAFAWISEHIEELWD